MLSTRPEKGVTDIVTDKLLTDAAHLIPEDKTKPRTNYLARMIDRNADVIKGKVQALLSVNAQKKKNTCDGTKCTKKEKSNIKQISSEAWEDRRKAQLSTLLQP